MGGIDKCTRTLVDSPQFPYVLKYICSLKCTCRNTGKNASVHETGGNRQMYVYTCRKISTNVRVHSSIPPMCTCTFVDSPRLQETLVKMQMYTELVGIDKCTCTLVDSPWGNRHMYVYTSRFPLGGIDKCTCTLVDSPHVYMYICTLGYATKSTLGHKTGRTTHRELELISFVSVFDSASKKVHLQ